MSRYERRIYFEALCEMRDRYDALTAADRTAVISVEEAMAFAEELLLIEPAPEPETADQPKA
jgi:hypothetical protein